MTTVFPIPATMKAPRDRRAGIWREGVLQIWVTRKCDKACVSCTQGSNLTGDTGMMTPEQFRTACRSLKEYFGVVGMFGGNPAVHPQFEELCSIMREEIPFEQCGLWSNKLFGKGAVARQTFNPQFSNLNVHLDREAYEEIRRDWPEAHPKGQDSDSRHSPPFVAMQDVIESEEERWRLIAQCDVNQFWSAMICVFRGELRGFFCELAGAQAMLHQHEPDYPDLGHPVVPGWWDRPIAAFDSQIRFHCHACGMPLRGAGDLAIGGTVERVSRTHLSVYTPKVKSRDVQVIADRRELGAVPRATDYLENSKKERVVENPIQSVRRIDGLTVCVGASYACRLARALPTWLDTLDSLTVVTAPHDEATLALLSSASDRVRVVKTDLFYQHGAMFNKGAALSHALALMPQADDWILHVDADIVAEPDWRKKSESAMRQGCLHGADRYYDDGTPIDDAPFPCGYFQLWNVCDPKTWLRPLYEPWYGHAGNYDHAFLKYWPESERIHLPIRLTHYGEPRSQWFGVDLEPEKQHRAAEEMQRLHRIGLYQVFVRGEGSLSVPAFRVRVCIEPGDAAWVRSMLSVCTLEDPFAVSARVGIPAPGDLFVPGGTTESGLRELLTSSISASEDDCTRYRCGCVNTMDRKWGVLRSVSKCLAHVESGHRDDHRHYMELGCLRDGIPQNFRYIQELVEPMTDLGIAIPPGNGGCVLEIGSGTSMYAPLFFKHGYQYEAVEPSSWAAEWTRSTFDVIVHQCTFEDLSNAEPRYAAIMAAHSFEHMVDSPAMFARAFDLLLPGGRLYVIVPDDSDPVNPDHYWFYNAGTLRSVLERIGFTDILITMRKRVDHENFIYCFAAKQ